jgi:arsenate reductase
METIGKTSVLFLCTGNSARSQMAEGFLRQYGGERFEAFSAGLEPRGIHPYTRQVMEEIGIDLSSQRSKDISEYMGKRHFSYLVTVCAHAERNCPKVFPGVGQRLHWALDDPPAFEGTEAEKLDKFRQVRDEIASRIRSWISQLDTETNSA